MSHDIHWVRAYGITESFHRIIIKVSYQNLIETLRNPAVLKKYRSLSQHSFYHYLILFTPEDLRGATEQEYPSVLENIRQFIRLRYLEENPTLRGEVSPSEEFLSKEVPSQRYMFSLQIPLHKSLKSQILALLSLLLTENLSNTGNEVLSFTYVIFQLLHNNDNIYSSPLTNPDHPDKTPHHVFELLASSSAAVKDYQRIDDYNNIKHFLQLLAELQQTLLQHRSTSTLSTLPVYWGINANSITQEHDYLDYFLLLYQELSGKQYATHHFGHRKPEKPYEGMIYNTTDQNQEHLKDPEIYGKLTTPLTLEIHAVSFSLSSNQVLNFRIETMELVQSFGLNTILEIPPHSGSIEGEVRNYFTSYLASAPSFDPTNDNSNNSSTNTERIQEKLRELQSLATEKYHLPIETFLCKCLLQLGNSLVFSFSEESFEELFITKLARLCHPFSYRKEYVSTVKIISIELAIEDLETFTEASREEELKEWNLKRKEMYLQSPPIKPWQIQTSK